MNNLSATVIENANAKARGAAEARLALAVGEEQVYHVRSIAVGTAEMERQITQEVMGDPLPAGPYLRDIGAAWLVLERLRSRGFRPRIEADQGNKWLVELLRDGESIAESDWSSWLPFAICQAAMRAIRWK